MPSFGKRSRDNLNTAELDLQILFNIVIKYFDCSVLYGHRSTVEQFDLYKKGREYIDDKWVVVNRRKVVTNCDGIDVQSKHNTAPSKAVDVLPYPIEWGDTDRMYMFVGFVRGIATLLNLDIVTGADWDGDTQVKDQTFNDLAHFELIN